MQNCCFANLRVRFFTEIQVQVKNLDYYYYFFSLIKETMYLKRIIFNSFISIEMIHNIDGILEKE